MSDASKRLLATGEEARRLADADALTAAERRGYLRGLEDGRAEAEHIRFGAMAANAHLRMIEDHEARFLPNNVTGNNVRYSVQMARAAIETALATKEAPPLATPTPPR